MATEETLHATALAVDGRGVLLRGASGAGKSDLALRCLAAGAFPFGSGPFRLVADDRVVARRSGCGIELHAPAPLHGLIEVRGLGIRRLPAGLVVAPGECIVLALVIDLTSAHVERMPPSPPETATLAGTEIRRMMIAPFEASAPVKIAMALAAGIEAV